MTIRTQLFAAMAVMACMSSTAAVAEASCSVWLYQGPNYYWRKCVNDNGSVQCYRATDQNGSGAYEISCAD